MYQKPQDIQGLSCICVHVSEHRILLYSSILYLRTGLLSVAVPWYCWACCIFSHARFRTNELVLYTVKLKFISLITQNYNWFGINLCECGGWFYKLLLDLASTFHALFCESWKRCCMSETSCCYARLNAFGAVWMYLKMKTLLLLLLLRSISLR